jgi:hypothetical protein
MEYLGIVGEQAILYYGTPQEWHPRTTNHPYFRDQQYSTARLSYRGVVYPEVMLRFDLNRSELIILSPNNNNIVLFPENVDYAELHGSRIIYFRYDSLPGCPATGYYILLHSGHCVVLERQTATMQYRQSGNQAVLDRYFTFSTTFFLYKDGVYHTIRNRRALLDALSPHRRELKRYISSNRLNYRRNAAELVARAVIKYEELSNPL